MKPKKETESIKSKVGNSNDHETTASNSSKSNGSKNNQSDVVVERRRTRSSKPPLELEAEARSSDEEEEEESSDESSTVSNEANSAKRITRSTRNKQKKSESNSESAKEDEDEETNDDDEEEGEEEGNEQEEGEEDEDEEESEDDSEGSSNDESVSSKKRRSMRSKSEQATSSDDSSSTATTTSTSNCNGSSDKEKKMKKKAGRRPNHNKPKYYFNCYAKENHRSSIFSVAFNNWLSKDDENMIFATCGSNRCSVYQCPKDGGLKLLMVFADPDPEENFYTCAWSYHLKTKAPLIAVAGYRGVVRVIDVSKNQVICNFVGHGQAINEIKFHPRKPELLLSASKDHAIRLWNCFSNVLIAIFGGVEGHRAEVLSIDFDLSGERIISCGMDHALKLWNINTKQFKEKIELSRNFKQKHKPFPTILNHFPDFSTRDIHRNYVDCVQWFGNFILSKSCENSIICWKPGRLKQPKLKPNDSQSTIITEFKYNQCDLWFIRFGFNPYNMILAMGNQYGKVYVWKLQPFEIDDHKPVILSHPKSNTVIRQVAFSKDGSILVYVCDDGTVWRWNNYKTD